MKKGFFLKSVFNKFICFVLTFALTPMGAIKVSALTDTKVFTDPVENIYVGRDEGWDFIENLTFGDVGAGHWAKEAFFPSLNKDIFVCIPEPFIPKIGLGIKVA